MRNGRARPDVADVVMVLLSAAYRGAEEDPEIERALGSDPAEIEKSLSAAVLGLAGYHDGPGTGRPLPLADPARLARWLPSETLSELAAAVMPEPASLPQDLGWVHEQLLELRIERLASPAVCVRPSGVWVSASDVLQIAANERAGWVKSKTGLPPSSVRRLSRALAAAREPSDVTRALGVVRKRGTSVQPGGRIVLDASLRRRRSGAHYTPRELCRQVVERALAPLLQGRTPEEILELRVCDPAMGSGAFLVEAARLVADHLFDAWRIGERAMASREEALRLVVTRCLYGVDRDPVARDLCHFSLTKLAKLDGEAAALLASHLQVGDAVVGRTIQTAKSIRTRHPTFDWPERFPEIFGSTPPGFDACLGNPPWVAYVGRAAQPLDSESHAYYAATNPAFRGYRTLHGLFVRRSAELLAPGGRLGLVLPTSVADLAGYAPTRNAHDELCIPDDDLLDFGNGAFAGVFQPCMGLTSTRTDGPRAASRGATWCLQSRLPGAAISLLERLSKLPVLDSALFGERGYQTTASDQSHLARLRAAKDPFTVPIHEGIDVGELSLATPSVFLDPGKLSGKLRTSEEWRRVSVLIRQTARYPIAAVSDGHAFRNSILAGFATEEWSAPALAAYLNSLLVRWFHYTRHRDAREGMPQLKIGHLRALPGLADADARKELHAIGENAWRSSQLSGSARMALDAIVFDAFGLHNAERQLILEWAAHHPVPRPRRRPPD